MLTAKICLAESGQVADLQKDFPVYQGQFQNILLNVFVPTSLLAANFTEKTEDYGDLTTPFVAGTAVKIAMRTVARNGAFKVSNDHYLRYVKTLMKDGVQYALYERKMPREFTFYAGQGVNAPTLIVNVVNVKYGEITAATASSENAGLTCSTDLNVIKQKFPPVTQKYDYTFSDSDNAWYLYGTRIGTTDDMYTEYGIRINGIVSDQDVVTLSITASEPAVTNIATTQTMRLDVMPSSDLDNDTAINADEWDLVEATITSLTASINALVTAMPLKQDISDAGLETVDKTVVGAINEVNAGAKETDTEVDELQQRVSTLEQTISAGETPIGTMTVTTLPTNEELSAFVEANTTPSRKPRPGDTVIVILQIPDATDKNYKYIYSGETQSWNSYEIPPLELAANGTAGIVSGTYSMTAKGYNVLVDIVDGEIRDIYAKVGTSANYVSVKNQLDILTTIKDAIIAGTQAVGVAERAKADEAGNNILATYQTKASGATKQYVKDYALPKEFNDVKYLTADGYSEIVPTTPETGIQFTATSAAIGATELFSTAFTLADVEFTLGAKNSYSNNFYVSSSAAITAKLRLVTAIKKGTDEPVTVAAELSEDIAFVANKPQKVSFSATMSLLDDKVYELVQGDKIIQTLEIIRTDSASAAINVYCNTTYPSMFYLYTGSVVVLEAASVVQEEGTSKTAVMSQDAVTMALAKKLGTPYGVDFPHGAGTVTYDTTNGMHIRGTMRIYTSADKTLFVDVPNTEVEIPIKAGENIIIDKAATGEFVEVKTNDRPTYGGVTIKEGVDQTASLVGDGVHLTDTNIPSQTDFTNEAIIVQRLYSQGGKHTLQFMPGSIPAGTEIIIYLPTTTGTLALKTDIPTNYVTTDSAQTIPATAKKTFADNSLVLQETYDGRNNVAAYNAILEYEAHSDGLYFFNSYNGSLIKLQALLKATDLKTLFGDKSIVGSGNIDLYRHNIIFDYDNGQAVLVTISSKNTVIDSLTDLSSFFTEITAISGYYRIDNNVNKMASVCELDPKASGGIRIAANGALSWVSWSSLTGLTFRDTVTTV